MLGRSLRAMGRWCRRLAPAPRSRPAGQLSGHRAAIAAALQTRDLVRPAAPRGAHADARGLPWAHLLQAIGRGDLCEIAYVSQRGCSDPVGGAYVSHRGTEGMSVEPSKEKGHQGSPRGHERRPKTNRPPGVTWWP